MNTVLVTGASSGYGLETARNFYSQGWRVVATMRVPHPELLPTSDRMVVLPLDITDDESIAACVADAGEVDVLVNNAGVGMGGAFEATPMAQIRRIFETNTFGTMAVTQAFLPRMRKRRGGTIINVTSSATLGAFPFSAPYTASKAAIEGLSQALAVELEPFNVRVKLVEPGLGLTTRFQQNVGVNVMDFIPADYAEAAGAAFATIPAVTTTETDVAETIWRAAHDTAGQLRFPAGADAIALGEARR